MSGPSTGSLKFAFWLVCVIVLLHCFMMPTAVTVMAERTYKAKRGVLKTGLQPKEAYVPMSNSKWSKRSLCGIECHAKEWCLTFNFDRSTEKCELFDVEVAVSNSVNGDSSAYFGKNGQPVGIATTTTRPTTTASTTTTTPTTTTATTTTSTTTTPTTTTITTTATTTTATTTAPTTTDSHACGELPVLNGTNIPSGTKHESVVTITCNPGFTSIHKNVSCYDKEFKAHLAVKNASVASITCFKDCKGLVVTKGENVTAAVHHEEEVDIKCDAGLFTYYPKAVCNNGVFKPSRAICGDYPQIYDRAVMRWQGQFFKRKNVYAPHKWNSAAYICKTTHKNGIMATALSAELLLRLASEIAAIPSKYYAIGLVQKTSQSGTDVGWQWVNTGTNAVIDIDTNNTVKPVWAGKPDDYPHRTGGRLYEENNQENYGSLVLISGGLRFNDAPLQGVLLYVICQFGYPAYEFELVNKGSKLVFPHESSLVGVSLQNCTESCLSNAFCRTFSYSAILSDCWHHSTPPSGPEAIAKIDENYNIYA